MPRANRRRDDGAPLDLARVTGGIPQRARYAGGEWFVRSVTGAGAQRAYLCPGCQQDISVGVPHVVVWPADGLGGVDNRRHWHTQCWSARERRRPQGSFR
ncbi:MAG: hypothetical protein KBF43_12085 [Dermatophilaceae bacterium]|jgi:hypothetical protein|nr:hypothetical protein [Actinomycetales bacterium]MBP8879538.1 hypothetical protein [Dermatophilaceae bacterium]MBP9919318.1 hypothetical protein [Dermatophilaceae bacterium]